MGIKIRALIIAFFATFACAPTWSQADQQWDAAEIMHHLDQLQVVGSALYIAAHPDDENTRLISYLSNEEKVRTAYLSLTRGDGGQNLIGPELGPQLGVIRTQELLAAREIDGGEQFFTRAIDFGYSKSSKETLEIWDEKEVLRDMVWVIRKFRPDVMINRFNHETSRRTHGHHTASAQLSVKAFEMAGDPEVFPEQLDRVGPWQPKRLFFNTSWWFYGSREKFEEADKSNLTSVDIGTYFPLLGRSNNEIADLARSQHKCQGFGRSLHRGSHSEYLELIRGEWDERNKAIFGGLDIGWSRLSGGTGIGQLINIIRQNFDPSQPEEALPLLLQIRSEIKQIEDTYWKSLKLKEVNQIIKACAGMYFEAVTEEATATRGDSVEIAIESIVRRPMPVSVKVESIAFRGADIDTPVNVKLGEYRDYNESKQLYFKVPIPNYADYTSPFWLKENWSKGLYKIDDPELIGQAEGKSALGAHIRVLMGNQVIEYQLPVKHKSVDPAQGEIYEPFAITPPVFVNQKKDILVFADTLPKSQEVVVRSMVDDLEGTVSLEARNGWRVEPSSYTVDFDAKNQTETFAFQIFPDSGASAETALFANFLESGSKDNYGLSLTEINYDHIPRQYVMTSSKAKVIQLDLKRNGDRIGYIMGAGDEIPEYLRTVGYQVDLLNEQDIAPEELDAYDAVVLGIRAFNTLDWLPRKREELFGYVEEGGTLLVQYTTSRGLKTNEIAPLPLEISRDRVTDETAPMEILEPEHPVFQSPNPIDSTDFENWVQERGLYFAGDRDSSFVSLLASADPGEDTVTGSLVVLPYGEGYYIYTGISFFRQLPAGVAGAYRLFANLLALKEEN